MKLARGRNACQLTQPDAARHDRAGPDGGQPRPPADARRPPLRRLRRQRRARSRRSTAEGATGATSLADFVAKLETAAGRLDHGARPRVVQLDARRARPAAGRRATSSSTAATPTTATTSPRAKQLIDPRHPLRRLRHQRRRVGPGARLLPDDRRRGRAGRSTSTRSSRPSPPGQGSAEPTPGRTRHAARPRDGYLHCGPSGAGHFVKMVHNGIEYGMMAAIAEGLSIIKHANAGKHTAGRRRRDHAAARPVGLPVRHRRRPRSPRSGGAARSSSPGWST